VTTEEVEVEKGRFGKGKGVKEVATRVVKSGKG